MNKSRITTLLRKLRLMQLSDHLHFVYEKMKNRSSNRSFKINNPDVVLPPDYMIYESFQMNYDNYYNDSLDTAKWLISYFEKHIELKNVKILEWGCGPARIIRHLPNLLDRSCEIYGSDYNHKTIEWCQNNIPGIKFLKNNLQPPLEFINDFFDIIYATSVFTHLSEDMHYAWMNELKGVCKPNGIIFLTTHGDNCKPKLTDEELKLFEAGKLVVRGNVKEGHRTFAAYQPTEFMRKLFSDVEILEHVTRAPEGSYIPQDVWIVRKK
ncbi:MAG: class I SAM-dependent methyltransferase [Ignavibacteriaceae bacterium]|nr:class I SAM-dependent methyltransferase [Ignavibacteriaceae bacterium]